MPELTRRRSEDRPDCWHIYYGDVHAGTIAMPTNGNGPAASIRDRAFAKAARYSEVCLYSGDDGQIYLG